MREPDLADRELLGELTNTDLCVEEPVTADRIERHIVETRKH